MCYYFSVLNENVIFISQGEVECQKEQESEEY